jgi:hypothetical protein
MSDDMESGIMARAPRAQLAPDQKHRMKRRLLLVVVVVMLFGVATIAVAYAATSASAPVTKFTAVTEANPVCTNTTSYQNMPQMSRGFVVGGSTNDEVLVMFTASMNMFPGPLGELDAARVRLTIDGTLIQQPLDVQVLGSDDEGTAAFNWHTNALTPGTHTARVQWTTGRGNQLCAQARSLVVLSK